GRPHAHAQRPGHAAGAGRGPGAGPATAAGGLPPGHHLTLSRRALVRGDRPAAAALGRRRPQALGTGRGTAAGRTGQAAMNADETLPPADPFSSLLAACDEALAADSASPSPAALSPPPELRPRLERA